MESLYILIPIALLLAGVAIATFLWAVRSRQFDNLDMEARRVLFDDEPTLRNSDSSKRASADTRATDNPENKPHE